MTESKIFPGLSIEDENTINKQLDILGLDDFNKKIKARELYIAAKNYRESQKLSDDRYNESIKLSQKFNIPESEIRKQDVATYIIKRAGELGNKVKGDEDNIIAQFLNKNPQSVTKVNSYINSGGNFPRTGYVPGKITTKEEPQTDYLKGVGKAAIGGATLLLGGAVASPFIAKIIKDYNLERTPELLEQAIGSRGKFATRASQLFVGAGKTKLGDMRDSGVLGLKEVLKYSEGKEKNFDEFIKGPISEAKSTTWGALQPLLEEADAVGGKIKSPEGFSILEILDQKLNGKYNEQGIRVGGTSEPAFVEQKKIVSDMMSRGDNFTSTELTKIKGIVNELDRDDKSERDTSKKGEIRNLYGKVKTQVEDFVDNTLPDKKGDVLEYNTKYHNILDAEGLIKETAFAAKKGITQTSGGGIIKKGFDLVKIIAPNLYAGTRLNELQGFLINSLVGGTNAKQVEDSLPKIITKLKGLAEKDDRYREILNQLESQKTKIVKDAVNMSNKILNTSKEILSKADNKMTKQIDDLLTKYGIEGKTKANKLGVLIQNSSLDEKLAAEIKPILNITKKSGKLGKVLSAIMVGLGALGIGSSSSAKTDEQIAKTEGKISDLGQPKYKGGVLTEGIKPLEDEKDKKMFFEGAGFDRQISPGEIFIPGIGWASIGLDLLAEIEKEAKSKKFKQKTEGEILGERTIGPGNVAPLQ